MKYTLESFRAYVSKNNSMVQAIDVRDGYKFVEDEKPIIDLEIQDAGDGFLTTCLYHIHYDRLFGFCYRFDGNARRSWHFVKDDNIAFTFCKLCDYVLAHCGFTVDEVCEYVDSHFSEWQ